MKKRTIFNALMFLLIIGLGYILYQQIQDPIAFQQMKNEREKTIMKKLVKNSQICVLGSETEEIRY